MIRQIQDKQNKKSIKWNRCQLLNSFKVGPSSSALQASEGETAAIKKCIVNEEREQH